MATADEMIKAGQESGAWPTKVYTLPVQTTDLLYVPGKAVVAEYRMASERVAHGVVGDGYTPLDLEEWRACCEAAVAEGAVPAGAFALRGGSRVLATFEVPSENGIRGFINIVDSLDGSLAFQAGNTDIRTVCANTLSASFRRDGANYAWAKHTASLNTKVKAIGKAMAEHIRTGKAVKELYTAAKDTKLHREEATALFDALFPPAAEGASTNAKTRAENARTAAKLACIRPENTEGDTVATVWNAATWLVDRDENGNTRNCRGGADLLDSLLFGSRGERVREIHSTIREFLVPVLGLDGETQMMSVQEAAKAGVPSDQLRDGGGRTLLDSMLDDL